MLRNAAELWRDAEQKLRWRLFALVLLMAACGLTESLSIAALLPLLIYVGVGSAAGPGLAAQIGKWFSAANTASGPGLAAAGACAFFFLNYLLGIAQASLFARLQSTYTSLWRTQLFDAFIRARWGFVGRHRAGELVSAMTGEMNRLYDAFAQLCYFATAVLHLSIFIALALLLSWQVTVLILVGGSVLLLATMPLVFRAYRVGRSLTDAYADQHSLLGEFIAGTKVLKAFGAEPHASAKVHQVAHRLQRLLRQVLFDTQWLRATFEFGAGILLVILLIAGAGFMHETPAVLVVVLALFVRLFPKISALQQSSQALNVLLPTLRSLTALRDEALSQQEDPAPADTLGPISPAAIALRVSDLWVRRGERDVLQGVGLDLRAGGLVALIGESGAGKTTLVDCLLRLLEPSRGVIEVDGRPLATLPLTQWRRSIGYMSQDAILFNGTIGENIALGKPNASRQDITAAAQLAAAHEFIAALPLGYETEVGDMGTRLSGGERQRIALARALIIEPKLLILDEATSALDAQTEREVLNTLADLHGRITVIMITHRASAAEIADRIYLLDNGRIADSGTWTELAARSPRFQKLWDKSPHDETCA